MEARTDETRTKVFNKLNEFTDFLNENFENSKDVWHYLFSSTGTLIAAMANRDKEKAFDILDKLKRAFDMQETGWEHSPKKTDSAIIDLTRKKIDNFKEYEKIATVKAVQIPYQFKVETLEGTMTGNPNDWLAEGVHKERYPIRNEIFKKTYKEHK